MLMYSGHTVGLQMSVEKNSGIFCLQVNNTWFLTGAVHSFVIHGFLQTTFLFLSTFSIDFGNDTELKL